MMAGVEKEVRRGRPSRGEERCMIYLLASVYEKWKVCKIRAGMKKNTNSEFAMELLQRIEKRFV